METVAPYQEIIDVIKESGGDAFKRCFQCGLCDAVCPWNRVRPFSMRKIVREATFGLTEIESEDIWRCTTCGRCPQQCPRDVRQIDSGVALRRIRTLKLLAIDDPLCVQSGHSCADYSLQATGHCPHGLGQAVKLRQPPAAAGSLTELPPRSISRHFSSMISAPFNP